MAIETKVQLKTYFETGDVPTEQQFINLIDSHYGKIEGLKTAVTIATGAPATSVINIPDGLVLSRIIIVTAVPNTISIGDSAGSTEYADNVAITAAIPYQDTPEIFAFGAPKEVHITAAIDCTIHLWVQ